MKTTEIPGSEVVTMIKNLLNFRYPTICRHSVAADLLSLLEKYGTPVSDDLARAIVECDDEQALKELECYQGDLSKKITAAVCVDEIAIFLRDNKIPVQKVKYETDYMDAEVKITDDVYVQVGTGYAVVCKWLQSGIQSLPLRDDLADVINDIKSLTK